MRKTLKDKSLNFVKGKYRKELDDFRKSVVQDEVTFQELPKTIQNRFREMDGTLGRIVYIFPRHDANLTNGKKLVQFSDALSGIELSDGTKIRSSGESAIFADILRAIRVDGPLTSILSFLFCFHHCHSYVSRKIFCDLRPWGTYYGRDLDAGYGIHDRPKT